MLQRVDAMESELNALLESLRTGANRLQADLTLLEGNMGELYGSAGAGRRPATNAVAEEARRPEVPAPAAPPAAPEPPQAAAVEETVEVPAPEPVAPEPAAPSGGATDEDVEGARLIALNMALNGTAREETDRYLADNFDLSDRSALLDEVYASVEG